MSNPFLSYDVTVAERYRRSGTVQCATVLSTVRGWLHIRTGYILQTPVSSTDKCQHCCHMSAVVTSVSSAATCQQYWHSSLLLACQQYWHLSLLLRPVSTAATCHQYWHLSSLLPPVRVLTLVTTAATCQHCCHLSAVLELVTTAATCQQYWHLSLPCHCLDIYIYLLFNAKQIHGCA